MEMTNKMKKLISKEWGQIQRGYLVSYVCDSVSDIEELPTIDIAAGSTALVVEAGAYYIFSGEKWQKFGGKK